MAGGERANADVAFGLGLVYYRDRRRISGLSGEEGLRRGDTVVPSTVVHRRALYDEFGGWPTPAETAGAGGRRLLRAPPVRRQAVRAGAGADRFQVPGHCPARFLPAPRRPRAGGDHSPAPATSRTSSRPNSSRSCAPRSTAPWAGCAHPPLRPTRRRAGSPISFCRSADCVRRSPRWSACRRRSTKPPCPGGCAAHRFRCDLESASRSSSRCAIEPRSRSPVALHILSTGRTTGTRGRGTGVLRLHPLGASRASGAG